MGDGMFKWRSMTADPTDGGASRGMLRFLLSRRRTADIRGPGGFTGFLADRCRGKRVLDIGVCEHVPRFMRAEGWKHRKLKEAAARIVGVDILEPLVRELRQEGYDVRCMDATGDADLGERFDVVVCGDVIEHVENPAALLRFAGRHLAPGGKVLVSTPNPFYWVFLRELFKYGTQVANLEHTCFVTPSMAAELACRSGLELTAYYVFDGARSLLRRLVKACLPKEMTSMQFVYEYARAPEAARDH